MKPILDVTAGNRMMWPNKDNEYVIFLDKESGLLIKPDILADFRCLPFRDDVFSLSFFDPPHFFGSLPPFMDNKDNLHGGYYGVFKNRKDMVISIIKTQKELSRVSERLCFKWNEAMIKLFQILTCFTEWMVILKLQPKPRMGRRSYRNYSKNTWWVTFIRKYGGS